MSWLAEEFYKARRAVKLAAVSHRAQGGSWDAWFGPEAEMAFVRGLDRMSLLMLKPDPKNGSLIDGRKFYDVRLHRDGDAEPRVCILSYFGAPIRRFDLISQTAETIVDRPDVLSVEIKALAALRLPLTVRTPSFRFMEAPKPLEIARATDDMAKPVTYRKFDVRDFERKGLLSMRKTEGGDAWRIDLTLAGRNAIAQFSAWHDDEGAGT